MEKDLATSLVQTCQLGECVAVQLAWIMRESSPFESSTVR